MKADHVFLTLRVTGANTGIGKLNEIAAVRTDHNGNVLAAFSDSLVATPSARRRRASEVIERLREVIVEGSELHSDKVYEPRFVVVCWNSEPDRAILRATIENETDETEDFFKFHGWLSMMHLAWPLVYHDLVGDRSPESLCASFGFVLPKKCSISDECRALTKVYWALMARYKAALVAEEVVREVGGKPLQTVRKFLGW